MLACIIDQPGFTGRGYTTEHQNTLCEQGEDVLGCEDLLDCPHDLECFRLDGFKSRRGS